MFSTTALDIFKEETNSRSIVTLCKQLDRALGNGIPMGVITEFCGLPGSGKTQICMQLSVNVQIPKEIGGVGGKVAYIDTNQDFSLTRFKEIANGFLQRYETIALSGVSTSEDIRTNFNSETILKNFYYNYTSDHIRLMAAVELLKVKLENNIPIKLIIIDSLSFTFRCVEDNVNRTRYLYYILTELQVIAETYKLAVVITNEMTTRILNEKYIVMPALGDSHGHKIGQRIILGKKEEDSNNYFAILRKCIYSQNYSIPFQITQNGIRGIKK